MESGRVSEPRVEREREKEKQRHRAKGMERKKGEREKNRGGEKKKIKSAFSFAFVFGLFGEAEERERDRERERERVGRARGERPCARETGKKGEKRERGKGRDCWWEVSKTKKQNKTKLKSDLFFSFFSFSTLAK